MELSELIQRSQEIRSQSPNSRRLHWPAGFRQIVVEMVRGGMPILRISKGTGIAHQTIRGWVKGKPKKFQEVEISEDAEPKELILIWHEGLKIQGLGFDQLVFLLREGLL